MVKFPVNEQTQVEIALRESEARHRSIINNIPIGTFIIKHSVPINVEIGGVTARRMGVVSYISPTITEISGFPQDFFLNEDWMREIWITRIHPDDRVPVINVLNGFYQKGDEYNIEYRFKDKNGNWHWIYHHEARPIDPKDPNFAYGIFLDITDRKKAELALKEEHAKFQQYLNIVEVLILSLNPQNEITLINQAGCRILGYNEEELLGKNWFETCIPYHSRNDFIDTHKKFIAGSDKIKEVTDYKIITKNGQERTFSWNSSILKDATGNILGTLNSGIDITEMLTLNEEMTEKSKLAAVGQLAAGVAHELNTPLANIALTSELLIQIINDDSAFLDKEQFVKDLMSIQEEINFCSNIVQDLLHFSRKIVLNTTQFILNTLISETLHAPALNSLIDENNIKIELNLEKDLIIIGDRSLLLQVFQNLLNNAVDALKGNKTNPKITINARKKGNSLEIQFQDNGIGIKKENVPRVFEPFYTTKKTGKGTGLGLSISKGIIEKHNGRIHVKSTRKSGTIFTIRLPLLISKFKKSNDNSKNY